MGSSRGVLAGPALPVGGRYTGLVYGITFGVGLTSALTVSARFGMVVERGVDIDVV